MSEDVQQGESKPKFGGKLFKVSGNDYLQVNERVAWFREAYPIETGWAIHTEMILADYEAQAFTFRATVYNPEGGIVATATKHRRGKKGNADPLESTECVPVSTEILTMEGWKRYEDLELGELVLSYCHKTDTSEWVPLERVVSYANASVIRLHNHRGFDVICTPEHKWATQVQREHKGRRGLFPELTEPAAFTKGHKITNACHAPDMASTVSEEVAAIVGWLITDGAIQRKGGSIRSVIYQSKEKNLQCIREMLSSAGVEFRESVRDGGPQPMPTGKTYECLPSHRFHIGADATRRILQEFGVKNESEIPSALPSLSRAARQAMLDAMMLADGTKTGHFGKKRRPWVMDVFTLLCALQGISVGKTTWVLNGSMPIQCAKKTRFTCCSHLQRETAGRADVWCPTTKYGTWYARFANGTVTITGNTGAIGRALALCGFGTVDALDDMEDIADSPVERKPQPRPLAPQPLKTPKDQVAELIKQRFGDKPVPKGLFPKAVNLLLGRTSECADPVSQEEYSRVLKTVAEEYKTAADLELLVSAVDAFGGELVDTPIPNVVKPA